jgi:hypothetical protein
LKASHWVEILLTVALLIVGGTQAFIYWRQAGIMQTQADIAAKQVSISAATERANVIFEDVKVLSVDTSPATSGKVVGVFFYVSNSGNTQTKDFRAISYCKPLPARDTTEEPFSLFVWDDKLAVSNLIGPKQKKDIGACNVMLDQLPQIQAGDVVMYLLAEVRYKDRIDPNRPHKSRMSEQLFVSGVHTNDKGIAEFVHSTEPKGRNNCADEDCPEN